MRARLTISIVSLVTAIVVALSSVHFHSVVSESFDDAGSWAHTVADQVQAYVIGSVNRSPEAAREWRASVSHDPVLERILQESLIQTGEVVDVLVVDGDSQILASAHPARSGQVETSNRRWDEWQQGTFLWRLYDLFRTDSDLEVDAPIAVSGSSTPVMTVRVLLSPVLLRETVLPELLNAALLSVLALCISIGLAILVSRLVGDSFERLGYKIDRIAEGDLRSVQQDRNRFELPEMADLDSKLWWLGRQFTGTRTGMRQLQTNLEQMLRQMDDVVLAFGPDGRLQIAGDPAERLLARPRQDLLGRSIDELFPDWTGAGSALSQALASGRRLRDQPVTLERPNLPAARLLMTIEPVQYDDGAGTGTLVAFRNPEIRNHVRSELDTARRLAALSHITSGVAHEIKNPLNAMMLHVEIAQGKAQRGSDSSPELDIIRSELVRLDRVVKGLLDFHKPVDLRLGECDLARLVEEVAELIRPHAMMQGVHVALETERPGATILADPDLLKQGVLNVAVNGLEAMRHAGVLRLAIESGEGHWVIAIGDEGCGIAPEIRDRIFNLYFTTKQSGGGVGLAMTYRIVQLHGGTISVDSDPGRGACFRLGFPALQSREVAA